MPSPDQGHKSEPTSLDAERARLRSAGYTDAEVSQILIARASQQPAGAGQGALSNALSSIVAVAGHARAIIPTFRKDVATVFDGDATVSERAGATASLAVKAVVILVLAYAAWQEWQIHINYASEIAHQQALKATYDAAGAEWQTHQWKNPWATEIPPVPDVQQQAPTRADAAAVPTNETDGLKCVRALNRQSRALGRDDLLLHETPANETQCLVLYPRPDQSEAERAAAARRREWGWNDDEP